MTSEEIKRTVSMRSALEERGIPVNRSGFCKCPFHNDGRPSMKVYQNSVYCFSGCNRSWDLFQFVQDYDGVDFKEAFLRLGGTYGHMTAEKKRELSELEKNRKHEQAEKEEWKQRVDSNNKVLAFWLRSKQTAEENLRKGIPVKQDDFFGILAEYDKAVKLDDQLQEEGRKRKWIN